MKRLMTAVSAFLVLAIPFALSARTPTIPDTITSAPIDSIDLFLLQDSLWPPDHELALVTEGVTVSASFLPAELAVTVTSNEHSPDGEELRGTGNSTPDWEIIENDDGSVDVWLRAERSGQGNGRLYTIVALATNDAGETISDTAMVSVSHDQGKGNKGKGKKLATIDATPQVSSLLLNKPNPFNPSTIIAYELASPGPASLMVYNLLGQRIRVLAQGEHAVGRYAAVWDGRDERGHQVSSGVYLYRLVSPDWVQTRQMALVR